MEQIQQYRQHRIWANVLKHCAYFSVLCVSSALISVRSAYAEKQINWGYVKKPWYVSVSYSPAFEKISGFEIKESFGETRAVYPYKKDGKSVKLKAENFDWTTQDPKIGFKDNMLVAMEGS
ncbi:MAG: P44/Msp2 family outer membrane protein, partial [Aaplasma endosymbiont of Hyalomma asiaticum]